MARNLDPKCKQCRRIGEKLFLKGERCASPKCGMVKRNFPPGMHGPKGRTNKPSGFSSQLKEKQSLRKQYGILEKQFRLIFEKAKSKTGNTGENLLKLLEMRLDNTVYRLGLAESRNKARQLVNHGHITVNSKKVDIPSYLLKTGQIVKIKEGSKRKKPFVNIAEKLKNYTSPSWLNMNKELEAKVLHEPMAEDLEKIKANVQMVIEFYSR